MERVSCFVTAILIWALPASAQVRLRFLDSGSSAPIPYVHVLFDGDNGRYADEEGFVTVPEGIGAFQTHHISYEGQTILVSDLQDSTVLLVPLVQMLQPAVVLPHSSRKMKIGFADSKRLIMRDGRNGQSIAQFFKPSTEWNHTPLISRVLLNLFAVNLKKTHTASVDGQVFDDGITHVAKLRVDIREVDPDTGGPGESLAGGGVIYEIKDRFSLSIHKTHKVPLKNPVPFPEEGVFVVVEWIITEDVRKQDMVLPSIWLTRPQESSSFWMQSSPGSAWRKMGDGNQASGVNTCCFGLEILE